MPVVSLPDGRRVRFPDSMPREEIHAWIMQRFPDAAHHLDMLGQIEKGVGQGITSSVMDISNAWGLANYLPSIPFLSGELPGLPQHALEARRQAMKEAEKFADEPSEGGWQSAGKFAGGTLPYLALGPTGALGDVLAAGGRGIGRNLHHVAAEAAHLVGHKIGLPRILTRGVAEWLRNHPGLMQVGQAVAPAIGRGTGAVGQAIESRMGPGAGGIRAYMREPKRGEPEPKPEPKSETKSDLEDVKYVKYGKKD